MGWSGGSFTRDNGDYTGATVWQDDKTNGFKIQASRHDTHDQDLATGINACLNKDGSNSPTAQFTWLKAQYYAPTVGGTAAAQTITMSPAHTSYQTGELIIFKPSAMSTGATTLNKNALGPKTIKRMDGNDLQPGDLDTTRMSAVVYDGTDYILISSQDVRTLSRSTTFSSTNNSVVETTVLSYSVPAGMVRTSRKIRAVINAVFTNTSGATSTLRVRGKFGSSTFFDKTLNIGFSVTTIPLRVEFDLTAANTSTTVQSAISYAHIPAHGALTGAISDQSAREYADPGQDITAAKTLACTLTLGTASASIGFTTVDAFVELL